jgi:hypothetical protein
MIKILKGDDATHVVAIDLPEAAYADGVLIEFALGDLRLLMPSAPRVTLKFPASWTATQPCGRQLGNFTLISPAGERAAITKTYPVYITNDTSAVGTAGSISGNIIPAIDFSDLPSLDATSTPGDTKAVLNEILRRLKACCITLAMVLAVPFLGLAAEVKTAPLDAVGGTDSVVTSVSFEGLAKSDEILPIEGEYWKASAVDYGIAIFDPSAEREVYLQLTPYWLMFFDTQIGYSSYYGINGMSVGGRYYEKDSISDVNGMYRIHFPAIDKDETFAMQSDIKRATNNIPQTVTNVVRDVQGLVYDEKLNITWKQTMYDGNLYYIAVTNANITEVK